MGKIVAIGGGDVRAGSTTFIDKEIIKLSGKRHPRFLFVPTASSDSEGYWDIIKKHFGKLGCKTDVLFLIKKKMSKKEISDKILDADIIYVGGGNTLMMMRLWRKLGVDVLLKKAYQKNIVLSGLSAGSICWFDSGHSDSMSFYHPKKWHYINVRGLGLIKGVHCPHFDGETLGVKRKDAFRKMISKIGGAGIAIDNDCAIEFIDGEYRVIASKRKASAYTVHNKGGKVILKEVNKTKRLVSSKELYSR
jgi:dipeptidase E